MPPPGECDHRKKQTVIGHWTSGRTNRQIISISGKEENPALGYRAIGSGFKRTEDFQTQLQGTSACGGVWKSGSAIHDYRRRRNGTDSKSSAGSRRGLLKGDSLFEFQNRALWLRHRRRCDQRELAQKVDFSVLEPTT